MTLLFEVEVKNYFSSYCTTCWIVLVHLSLPETPHQARSPHMFSLALTRDC